MLVIIKNNLDKSIGKTIKQDNRNLIFLLRVKQPRSGKLKTEKNREEKRRYFFPIYGKLTTKSLVLSAR